MQSYTIIAPAKINLYLEILGDRPDGYHQLVMILQSIELADKIEISANGIDAIRLHCQYPEVPTDQSNLAYKAALLMKKEFPRDAANYGGVDISIEKHIPVAAGLAGGSSDCAAVLVGINLLWNLGLTVPELQRLAARLGSDIPFCISGGTAIATGRGEELAPLADLDHIWVVIAKYRSLAVSTAWAYNTYRQKFSSLYISGEKGFTKGNHRVHSGPLVQSIMVKDEKAICKLLHNDLEKVVLPEHSPVKHLRKVMTNIGGHGTMMSGSGPTVFTLCESQIQAETIKEQIATTIKDADLDLWVTKLCSHGIIVV